MLHFVGLSTQPYGSLPTYGGIYYRHARSSETPVNLYYTAPHTATAELFLVTAVIED